MADIFGFQAKLGRGFVESEKAVMIGEEKEVALVQNWNVSYNISVNPIFECGTSKVYWSAKHASGSLSVSRVVADDTANIRKLFGWVCKPATITVAAYTGQCQLDSEAVTAQPGGNPAVTPVNLNITGCILAGVTFSGNSQQAYVGEDISAQFVGLTVDSKAETAPTTVEAAAAT